MSFAEVGFGDNWSLEVKDHFHQSALFECVWTCEKWNNIQEDIPSVILRANPKRFGKPEIIVTEPNLVVTAGLNKILDIFSGRFLDSGWAATTAYFANWSAYIGVGDSSVAAAAAQTDLQAATNFLRVAMNASYPTVAASRITDWQSDFTASQAQFAWNERGLFNASTGGTMFCRHTSSMGTKSGGVWTLKASITASAG